MNKHREHREDKEYWVVEWSYTHEAIDQYIKNNPEQAQSYKVNIWSNLNTTNHTFEFCFAVMKDRVSKYFGEFYHWRIRDLHSGDIIPGEAL